MTKNGSPRLLQFTRVVINNPSFGKHVRRFSTSSLGCEYKDFAAALDLWNTSFDEKEVEDAISHRGASRSDLVTIFETLPGLGLRNGLLLHGGNDGVFIVLLHLLPKLRTLEIEVEEPSIRRIAYACFGVFGGRVPISLQSIVELSISSEGDPEIDGGFETEEVVPFMTLPSLRTFTMHNFSGSEPRHLQIGVPRKHTPSTSPNHGHSTALSPCFDKMSTGYTLFAKSGSITHLSFRSAVVSCDLLNRILALPIRLERFEFEFGDYDPNYGGFCASKFLPGLMSHSSSLKELIITCELPYFEWEEHDALIGSLSGMVALETLRIPSQILLASDEEAQNDSEIDDDDDDNNNDDDEADGWHLRLSDNTPNSTPHNPLDDLLPPNIHSLELDIGASSFAKFVKSTGFPQSLAFTRHRIPPLTSFVVSGESKPKPDVLGYFLKRVPPLDPPMKVTLFV
ncbi:hypothetical protein DL93DRAFT_2084921, partial [Clavulina sp. PMI_390]